MVLLGVLLVLLAAGAGVVLVAGTAQLTDSVQIDVLGGTLSIPPLTLLVTGMVVISVFWLGWVILRSGLRRGRRHRAEAKEAAAAAEAKRIEQARETKRLQDEFAAREQALIEERRLREEAEARAAGTGSHPTDTTPATGSTGGGTGAYTSTDPADGAHSRTGAATDSPEHTAVLDERPTTADTTRPVETADTTDATRAAGTADVPGEQGDAASHQQDRRA